MKLNQLINLTSKTFLTASLLLIFLFLPQWITAQIIEDELKLNRKNQLHKLIFFKEKEPVTGKIILMSKFNITLRSKQPPLKTVAFMNPLKGDDCQLHKKYIQIYHVHYSK